MSIRLTYCLFSILVGSSCLFGQGDPTELDSVVVNQRTSILNTPVSIDKIRLERRLATDVGQLMSLFTGVQTKSYGGLGGMKTVTFRSLGAGHVSVVSDHFALSLTQSGQADLGQIPIDFINNLLLVGYDPISINYPIHSKLAGQIIAMETRHLTKVEKFEANIGTQLGSFGQLDAHAFVSRRFSKWQVAASLKGRRFDGNYPFTYMNGQTKTKTSRTNGDLVDAFGTASVSYFISPKQKLHATYSGAYYNKGLPGAVVFYNETANQRLFGNNHLITLRHLGSSKRFIGSSGVSFQQSELNYVDSNYFNTMGYLHSRFISQESTGNSQWRYHSPSDSLFVLLGGGVRYEQLFSDVFSTPPTRFSTDLISSIKWLWKGDFSAQLGFQDIQDIRPHQTKRTTVLLPSCEWKIFKKGLSFIAGYRYTVRQPSFNELYYNQVGNDKLVPEKAQLAYTTFGYYKEFGNETRWSYQGAVQPFYVHAIDKILAIPTKNLFIWSIQNIGKSDAYGTEVRQLVSYRKNRFTTSFRLQYTFQYTLDLSDPNSSTYRDVLSYSPLHAGTAELNAEFSNWGASLLLTYQGERYALNQNIPSNLLEDFVLLDLSFFYKLSWRDHQLTTRLAINNLTNNYYSYIRYFLMPGTNIAFRLSYDF
ncbi:MAG: hypothetical protein QE487_14860 [Fluviicola sp.]|nr:hypothetical protein [Fluviicola sp.]